MNRQKTKPIRILQVFASLDCGGAETMLMNLYRNIDREKVQFDFIKHTDKRCFYEKEIESLGGRIFVLPRYNVVNTLKYRKRFKSLLDEHPEWRIMHSHFRSAASLLLPIANKQGLFTIIHSHSIAEPINFSFLIKRILETPLRYLADYYFACSLEAGIWLFGEKVVKSDKFAILQNAIDLNKFAYNEDLRQKTRYELGLKDKMVIGHVGRFSQQKNHAFLIDVFANLVKDSGFFVLTLVGDGPLRSQIEKLVKQKGIENNVIFLGNKSNVNEILNSFDLMVLPSINEGLGMVLIEAQANGLKCFASESVPREVAISELVEFIPLEKDLWVEKIKNLKVEAKNRNKLRSLHSYDVKKTADRLKNFYWENYYE